jgi:hypothetical protein
MTCLGDIMLVKYVLGMWAFIIQMHVLVLLHLNSHEIHAYLGLEDANLFDKSHIKKNSWRSFKMFLNKKVINQVFFASPCIGP